MSASRLEEGNKVFRRKKYTLGRTDHKDQLSAELELKGQLPSLRKYIYRDMLVFDTSVCVQSRRHILSILQARLECRIHLCLLFLISPMSVSVGMDTPMQSALGPSIHILVVGLSDAKRTLFLKPSATKETDYSEEDSSDETKLCRSS